MARKISLLLPFLLTHVLLRAQDSTIAMADGLRSNGKIYVVVAVVLTIFAGIVLYLVRLDRKLGKLEKQAFVDKAFNLKK